MRDISPSEARNIAMTVVEFARHRRWLDDGILEKLIAAAEGKTPDAAADAMERILTTCSRTVPYDDPHDAINPKRV